MAYVDGEAGREGSGQVIVLAGFLIAIAIITVAVLLNGLIFAQDLSTRDDGLDDREILGFQENTERMAAGLAHGIGHNSSGNITQDDLFADTDDVVDKYEGGVASYGENATTHLENRQGIAEVEAEIEEEDTAWIVGQRGSGDLGNQTGADEFAVFEDQDDLDDAIEEFRFSAELDNAPTDVDDFRIVASDDFPPGLAGDAVLEFNTTTEEIVLNESGTETDLAGSVDWSSTDNFTMVSENPQDGNVGDTLIVDGNQVDDGDHNLGNIIEDMLDDTAAAFGDEFTISMSDDGGISDVEYVFRVNGGVIEEPDNIVGPCNSPPCVHSDGDRELHAVAAVDDGSFTYRYIDSDAEYERTVSGIRAEQDGLPLEVVDE